MDDVRICPGHQVNAPVRELRRHERDVVRIVVEQAGEHEALEGELARVFARGDVGEGGDELPAQLLVARIAGDVERREGFVEQEHFRSIHECTGQGDALLLPTGELIEVVVLSINGNQVKLGTDAPKHLPVVREELLEVEQD